MIKQIKAFFGKKKAKHDAYAFTYAINHGRPSDVFAICIEAGEYPDNVVDAYDKRNHLYILIAKEHNIRFTPPIKENGFDLVIQSCIKL